MQRRKIASTASSLTVAGAGEDATPVLGLRDRKRLATRRRLEESAVVLAAGQGLEQATIEAISERAGVSPRTFFNYFDCKEDAVLGIREVTVSDDLLRDHAERYAGADALESIVGLLAMTTEIGFSGPEHRDTRQALVERYPHLLARLVGFMTRLADGITDASRDLLARDPHWGKVAHDPGMTDTVVGMCFGAFKHCLMAQGEEPGSLGSVEREALALVRRASSAPTPRPPTRTSTSGSVRTKGRTARS